MQNISEYEREREANIARNRALLEQLEIKGASKELALTHKTKAKTHAKPIQPAKKVKKDVVEAPRRQSSRLRKTAVDLNESPSKKRKRLAEEEEKRKKEEEERLEAEERAREAKRPRHHDLDLSTLSKNTDASELASLNSALQVATATARAQRALDIDAFVVEREKEDAAVTELQDRLQSLKVVARAKVTKDRAYSAAYHPEPTKDLIFFGDKHGQLGIWDARAPLDEQADGDDDVTVDDREGGKYWQLQVHWPASSKSSISSIKVDPVDSHTIYTSAYDYTVRSLSLSSGVSRELFVSEYDGDPVLITSLDMPTTGHEMWISDGLGGVTHLDLREGGRTRGRNTGRRYSLSDQKIGSVSVNPRDDRFLLTASNNRVLKLWDARKLDTFKSGDPLYVGAFLDEHTHKSTVAQRKSTVLRGEYPHGKSVSSAYWDPRGRGIVSTSYDDTIRLWDIDKPAFERDAVFPSFKPFTKIPHNCQSGKWVTILRAQWTTNPDVYPHFTIGNMDHSVNIFSCKGEPIAKLSDPQRITAVQAVTCSHPSVVERVATGNATGRCVLWAPEDLRV